MLSLGYLMALVHPQCRHSFIFNGSLPFVMRMLSSACISLNVQHVIRVGMQVLYLLLMSYVHAYSFQTLPDGLSLAPGPQTMFSMSVLLLELIPTFATMIFMFYASSVLCSKSIRPKCTTIQFFSVPAKPLFIACIAPSATGQVHFLV